ncbi:MAG: hypothetical protein JRF02_06075 [Deltaproteobacteria bacterium]|jgi:lauroyl/myristoyl acyltransferase|nr:hypothetical protein [Deltaproteobacteria bacterium]
MTWLCLFLKGGISNFFQTSFNIFLARKVPIRILRFYIYFIGFLYFQIKRKDLKSINHGLNYFRFFTNKNTCIYNIYLGHKTLKGTCEHYLEKLIMAYRPLSKLLPYFGKRLTINKRQILDEALKSKGGAIIVTGHFGAVEFLPMALYLKGYNVAMICKFKSSNLKQELADRAKSKNITLIDADEPKVAIKALQALKSGKILITECDEFKEWRTGSDKINILGTRHNSDKTLEIFYRKSKVPVILGLMRRDDKGKYTLCLEHLANGEEKINIAETAWGIYGKYIEHYPYQWYQWVDFSRIILQKALNDKENFHIPSTYPIPVSNST